MTAGELREMIRFDRRTIRGDDGYGNVVNGWATFAGPLPARVEGAAGSEEVQAGHVIALSPVTITVRYCQSAAAVRPQDRAVDQRTGRTWNITSVANLDERRAYITVTASGGAADG